MNTSAQLAINYVLQNEKGLEENPNDPGGITNYGISLRFLRSIDARKYGIYNNPVTEDDIRNLTIDQAKDIYLNEFWNKARFSELTNQTLCNHVFDMAINQGISPAIKSLQRAYWSVFCDRTLLLDDGILGDKTIKLINDSNNLSVELIAAMRSERAGEYRVIASTNPQDREFLNGWLNRAYKE